MLAAPHLGGEEGHVGKCGVRLSLRADQTRGRQVADATEPPRVPLSRALLHSSPSHCSIPCPTQSILRRQFLPGRLKSHAAQSSSVTMADGCRQRGRESGMGVCGGMQTGQGRAKQGASSLRECPILPVPLCPTLIHPPLLPPPPHLQPVGQDDVGVHRGDVEMVDEGTLLPGRGGREGRV